MRTKKKQSPESIVREIMRKTRCKFTADERDQGCSRTCLLRCRNEEV